MPWLQLALSITGLLKVSCFLPAGNQDPYKVFDRQNELNDCQIINYRSSSNQSWLALIGIAQRDGRIAGTIQLYSTERKQSQIIEGHAADFADVVVSGATTPSTMFCFAQRTAAAAKLFILEVVKGDAPAAFPRRTEEIFFPPEAGPDFPVAVEVGEKFDVVFVVTKFGYMHMYDIETGAIVFRNRISSETVFVCAPHKPSNGVLCVNRKGQVLLVSVNPETVVGFIANALNNKPLAIAFAARSGLPGADHLVSAVFDERFRAGDIKGAAVAARDSPKGMLRNQDTINKFKNLPPQPGQAAPLLQYFGTLLEKGKLNALESLELTRLVVSQGRKELLEKWLTDDKLECTERLGDEVKPHDARMALSIYYRADAVQKVIACFAETGEFEKIVAYAQKKNVKPDFTSLFQRMIQQNQPQAALRFAQQLVQAEGGPLLDINQVVNAFTAYNMIQETTSLLLDYLKPNREEDGALQTKLLEINLLQAPQVADAILSNNMFTHYDRTRVAQLCEKAGLFQRALEHYDKIADIRRVVLNTHAINPEWLINYFGSVPADDRLECLKDMLRANIRQNLQVVVLTCARYVEDMKSSAVISMFEALSSWEGVFYYLQRIYPESQDPDVHFKFIQAAVKVGQFSEVERVVRESSVYDPEKVRDFLKEAKLPDQLPLIIVCDRFDFIEDLTRYLYKSNLSRYIEAYTQQINPVNTPLVVGALMDVDCPEDYIKGILNAVRALCPAAPLIEQVEKRHRLKVIQPWIEARVSEGSQDPAVHNALMKIYIISNNNAEHHLQTNPYYDTKVVGEFCIKGHPHLAVTAYKRGNNHYELIEVTNKNSLFKLQSEYLVEQKDPELWRFVLSPENEFKDQVVEQVVQYSLPAAVQKEQVDSVSATVAAFMAADMPLELIGLLEKCVLESRNPNFNQNQSLQNLLIGTAIQVQKSKVMEYINRLDKYDGPAVATTAIEAGLFDEAFAVYEKFKEYVQAVSVLIDHLQDLPRAATFAVKVNVPAVWSKVANAQLQSGDLAAACASYIKAEDPDNYHMVIGVAEQTEKFEDIVQYLLMCRKLRNLVPRIETALLYSYAKTGMLAEMEEYLSAPNSAQVQEVGDRCFQQELYEAAKLCFASLSNFGDLATTLVKLGQYSAAVDAARKANSPKVWKQVCFACVDAGEFKLASMCGQQIVVVADELESLVSYYEQRGHFDQIITLIEQSLGLERAHVGLFTELANLLSNYHPDKLMDHLNLFYARMNIPKVIRTCQMNQQWPEVVFLQSHYDEFDNATNTMMEHSADCFDHPTFKQTVVKVSNSEICYKAITFYLEEHPLLVNDILSVLIPRLEHARVTMMVDKKGKLPFIKQYLQSVQDTNISPVNEGLNRLFIEEEDFAALRASIADYDNFDQIGLAMKLEKHDLVEFRRVAAELYRRNKRFDQAINIAKGDRLYKDAIDTAAYAENSDLAEALLKYFVEEVKSKECFAACLFTCYGLIRPDVALELAWKNQIIDFVMPFMIQVVREYIGKVDTIEKKLTAPPEEQAPQAPGGFQPMGLNPGMLALPGPGGVYGMPY